MSRSPNITAKNKKLFDMSTSSKDVALRKDKDDTVQVLSEYELTSLLFKRKIDPVWNKIQYIQAFIKSKRGFVDLTRVYFNQDEVFRDPLYNRAVNEVNIINGEVPIASSDYVSNDDEEKYEERLRNANPTDFCKYLLYKMVAFVETSASVKIKKITAEFFRDEHGECWLFNMCRLNYMENVPAANITGADFYLKKLNMLDPVEDGPDRIDELEEDYHKYHNKLSLEVQMEYESKKADLDKRFQKYKVGKGGVRPKTRQVSSPAKAKMGATTHGPSLYIREGGKTNKPAPEQVTARPMFFVRKYEKTPVLPGIGGSMRQSMEPATRGGEMTDEALRPSTTGYGTRKAFGKTATTERNPFALTKEIGYGKGEVYVPMHKYEEDDEQGKRIAKYGFKEATQIIKVKKASLPYFLYFNVLPEH
eukprot:TRINITY_DN1746_c0_g1_i3.p1 TRINITY_DN1746_c0_g1~~TRINITY_DN1746_c0_g1_i3.p1  ORF type:complete len:420 (-),score=80.08 TRINITY_DN1746_c0_g1_i3:176-1435(-)